MQIELTKDEMTLVQYSLMYLSGKTKEDAKGIPSCWPEKKKTQDFSKRLYDLAKRLNSEFKENYYA